MIVVVQVVGCVIIFSFAPVHKLGQRTWLTFGFVFHHISQVGQLASYRHKWLKSWKFLIDSRARDFQYFTDYAAKDVKVLDRPLPPTDICTRIAVTIHPSCTGILFKKPWISIVTPSTHSKTCEYYPLFTPNVSLQHPKIKQQQWKCSWQTQKSSAEDKGYGQWHSAPLCNVQDEN